MRYEDEQECAAWEILPLLPGLVETNALQISAEIEHALVLPSGAARSDALTRALSRDARVEQWIARRIEENLASPPTDQGGAPPDNRGYETLPGISSSATEATKFVCKTADCPRPDTWYRGFVGEETPRCGWCSRVLSRASE